MASRWWNRESRTFEYHASISVDKDTAIHYAGDSSKYTIFQFCFDLIHLINQLRFYWKYNILFIGWPLLSPTLVELEVAFVKKNGGSVESDRKRNI